MNLDARGYPQLGLLIGGEWQRQSATGQPVVNPANETELAWLPHAGTAELDDALAAAADGLRRWRATAAAERAALLVRTARLLAERREAIARIVTLEQGKPLAEARGELDRVIELFEWYGGEALRVQGTVYPPRGAGIRPRTLPEPVGVVVALTPWNFPAFLPARKLAPALAAGCSVILKAAEETPGTAVALATALTDAGLPAGVLNLVFGQPAEVSTHLLASSAVRKVSFTGSVQVGKLIGRLASANLQRCTLELGGHSPVIVFDDADLERVVAQTAAFKFRNAGQVCLSPNRFFVQEGVYRRFLDEFCARARSVKLGDGLEADTQMGPMANQRRIQAMEALVEDATASGGRLAVGEGQRANRGYYWTPTVLADLPDTALAMREETFGPVAPIVPFRDLEEVVSRANGTRYGLAAYVFTDSMARASQVAEQIEAGTVCLNTLAPAFADVPAGGVKDSGYGYEGGHEGLEAYLAKKTVCSLTV